MSEYNEKVGRRAARPSCNVSSAFNYGVGVAALVAAALITWFVVSWLT